MLALKNFREFGSWLPTLGRMLFDAVHAESPSAGGFDLW